MRTVLFVHFWSHIDNQAGSVEKVILGLCAPSVHYKSHIACLSHDNIRRDSQFQEIEVHEFGEDLLRNRLYNKLFNLKVFTYSSLLTIIDTLKPDIVHFHNRQELVDKIIQKSQHRFKAVVHYHRHFTNLIIPQQADLLLAPSHASIAYVQQFNSQGILAKVLYNGIPDYVIQQTPRTLPTGAIPKIIYGGGDGLHKGIHELIASLAYTADPFELSIFGNGTDKLTVVDKRVKLQGKTSYRCFIDAMLHSDIVIMPSKKEPFGLVALEAMCLRKLVICSQVDGLAEFTDATTAIIINPESPPDIAQKIKEALRLLYHPSALKIRLDEAEKRSRSYTKTAISQQLHLYYDALFAPDPPSAS